MTLAKRKSRWLIITPTGDEIVFDSLTELTEAVNEAERDDQGVATYDPDVTVGGTRRLLTGGTLNGLTTGQAVPPPANPARVTNVGGFSRQEGRPPPAGPSGTSLLRHTPVPEEPRARRRGSPPPGVFAMPTNARAPGGDAMRRPRALAGPSGTRPGLIAPAPGPVTNQTSPGLPPPASPKTAAGRELAVRLPRLSSVQPTRPGVVSLRTATSPGLPPNGAVAIVPMTRLDAVPNAAPQRGPARATPSPEPSMDSVDAVWAAMLQSTSKFVPFPIPRGRPATPLNLTRDEEPNEDDWAAPEPDPLPSRGVIQAVPSQGVIPSRGGTAPGIVPTPGAPAPVPNYGGMIPSHGGTAPGMVPSQGVIAAQRVVPSQGVLPVYPAAMPSSLEEEPSGAFENVDDSVESVPDSGERERAPFGDYGAPGQNAFDLMPGPLPDLRSPLPHRPAFVDYGDENPPDMPPPSLPVRGRPGPDLSEAMREQSPGLETPRYSIPSYDEDDTPGSGSMQLIQTERRFPRWWLPLIAAAGFGAGVLIVVGREAPRAASTATETAPKASAQVREPTVERQVAAPAPTETAPPVASAQMAPAPIAPTPIAPTPIATSTAAPVASEHRAVKTERQEAPAEAAGAQGEAAPAKGAGEGKNNYERAIAAQRAGDMARAQTLYRAVIAKDPHNFEAQNGLGDVERQLGDKSAAILSYRRALAENPSFFPAMLGLADTLWDTGDKSAAVERYVEIGRRFSPSMYPNRVRERTSEKASEKPSETEAPPATP